MQDEDENTNGDESDHPIHEKFVKQKKVKVIK